MQFSDSKRQKIAIKRKTTMIEHTDRVLELTPDEVLAGVVPCGDADTPPRVLVIRGDAPGEVPLPAARTIVYNITGVLKRVRKLVIHSPECLAGVPPYDFLVRAPELEEIELKYAADNGTVYTVEDYELYQRICPSLKSVSISNYWAESGFIVGVFLDAVDSGKLNIARLIQSSNIFYKALSFSGMVRAVVDIQSWVSRLLNALRHVSTGNLIRCIERMGMRVAILTRYVNELLSRSVWSESDYGVVYPDDIIPECDPWATVRHMRRRFVEGFPEFALKCCALTSLKKGIQGSNAFCEYVRAWIGYLSRSCATYDPEDASCARHLALGNLLARCDAKCGWNVYSGPTDVTSVEYTKSVGTVAGMLTGYEFARGRVGLMPDVVASCVRSMDNVPGVINSAVWASACFSAAPKLSAELTQECTEMKGKIDKNLEEAIKRMHQMYPDLSMDVDVIVDASDYLNGYSAVLLTAAQSQLLSDLRESQHKLFGDLYLELPPYIQGRLVATTIDKAIDFARNHDPESETDAEVLTDPLYSNWKKPEVRQEMLGILQELRDRVVKFTQSRGIKE